MWQSIMLALPLFASGPDMDGSGVATLELSLPIVEPLILTLPKPQVDFTNDRSDVPRPFPTIFDAPLPEHRWVAERMQYRFWLEPRLVIM